MVSALVLMLGAPAAAVSSEPRLRGTVSMHQINDRVNILAGPRRARAQGLGGNKLPTSLRQNAPTPPPFFI
eukprot:9825969-Alexandrium_andersonii.AAC.1